MQFDLAHFAWIRNQVANAFFSLKKRGTDNISLEDEITEVSISGVDSLENIMTGLKKLLRTVSMRTEMTKRQERTKEMERCS